MIAQDILGVDIAKNWIDVFHLSASRHERIATPAAALRRFARAAKGALVVLEASGGYERPVTEALAEAGTAYARVNPRQARAFACVCGRLAKTDRVDAQVLAEMGQKLGLTPPPPQGPERARLSDLVARREDLVATIRAEKNRVETTRDVWLTREIAALLAVLGAHLRAVETAIAALIETRDRLAAEARRLRSAPGIGPTLAAILIARLPELGQLGEKRIAALAGLAPQACDSGLHRGKRRIWGGRADVRRALYLAGFIASRYDPVIKAFRQRLEAAGKPPKLAITACARKLPPSSTQCFATEKTTPNTQPERQLLLGALRGMAEGYDSLLIWIILAAIFTAVATLFGWLLWSKSQAFWRAMIRLRDRIDRSKRL